MGYNFKLPRMDGMSQKEQALFLRAHIEELQWALNNIDKEQDSIKKSLSEKDKTAPYSVSDTGWVSLGLSTSVSESTHDNGRNGAGCFYRVVNGNHVYIAFNCALTYSGGGVTINANTIPAHIRPPHNVTAIVTGTGKNIARSVVTKLGTIIVEWVQYMADSGATTSATLEWLDGFIEYFI
jgi:hypothetical protein